MTTRAELLADVNAWTARDDVGTGTVASTILRLAESKINRLVRNTDMETIGTLTTVAGVRTVTVPTDLMSLRSVTIDSSTDTVLTVSTPELIREDTRWLDSGAPEIYTREARTLYLAPTPSEVMTLDIVYYGRVTPLVGDGDTNDLLTNNYDLYLWAVCEAAAKYVQDGGMAAVYGGDFDRVLSEVNDVDKIGRFSGSSLKSQSSSSGRTVV